MKKKDEKKRESGMQLGGCALQPFTAADSTTMDDRRWTVDADG